MVDRSQLLILRCNENDRTGVADVAPPVTLNNGPNIFNYRTFTFVHCLERRADIIKINWH